MLAERRRRRLLRSMLPAQARVHVRAPSPLPSTQLERSRDSSGTPTMPGTDSCALPTGPLPSSTIQARALAQHLAERSGTARVRVLSPSIQLGRSQDFTLT